MHVPIDANFLSRSLKRKEQDYSSIREYGTVRVLRLQKASKENIQNLFASIRLFP
jgi:hypothetical protein